MCESIVEERVLTPEEVIEHIHYFTYKPGHYFSVYIQDEMFHLSLNILKHPDATNPDATLNIIFTQKYNIEELRTWDLLCAVMKSFIMDWEYHEMKEWFKDRTGQCIFHPHPL